MLFFPENNFNKKRTAVCLRNDGFQKTKEPVLWLMENLLGAPASDDGPPCIKLTVTLTVASWN